jgi:hypothetical protein
MKLKPIEIRTKYIDMKCEWCHSSTSQKLILSGFWHTKLNLILICTQCLNEEMLIEGNTTFLQWTASWIFDKAESEVYYNDR